MVFSSFGCYLSMGKDCDIGIVMVVGRIKSPGSFSAIVSYGVYFIQRCVRGQHVHGRRETLAEIRIVPCSGCHTLVRCFEFGL